ncbi:NUDIX hydrolase [Edaphobacter sp. HDX4]|uniref:NUDIX hydrolase n=1 Tax=Edaphobacter sp. HDX4 TaxID=2794064 RepID=UPI002FE5EEC5
MAAKTKITKKATAAHPASDLKAKAGSASSKPAVTRSKARTKVLSSKVVFKGKVFSVFRDEVIEPGGSKNIREVIRHNGSVVILAIDESRNPSDPDVILERQYRHAAGQFLLELPAGRVEPGEATLAAAKREMIEETGYRAKRWSLLTKYFASPGFLGEWMQIYLARDIRDGNAQPEADENIEVIRMPLSEALALASQNKIHDGKTLIALMLYDRLRRENRL